MDKPVRSYRLSRHLPAVCRLLETTQCQLAEQLGIRDETVWRWKYKGQSRRHTSALLEWAMNKAREQGIDIDELLDRAEELSRQKWKEKKRVKPVESVEKSGS